MTSKSPDELKKLRGRKVVAVEVSVEPDDGWPETIRLTTECGFVLTITAESFETPANGIGLSEAAAFMSAEWSNG